MDDQDPQGITAYHGSPHEFEKFDTSKIGTGEGAQAYGHGLYFAEAEPVARGYRDNLAKDFRTVDGRPFEHGNPLHEVADYVQNLHGNDRAAAIAKHKQLIEREKSYFPATDPEIIQNMLRRHNILDSDIPLPKIEEGKGHMYEVHIDAHPDHFLDWDHDLNHDNNAVVGDALPALKHYGRVMSQFEHTPTGGEFYEALSHMHGSQESASKALQNIGIHGIRYLDAGSRANEANPTHNYVVFDQNRVNVKRRYSEGGDVEHEPHKRAEEQGYSIKGYHVTRGGYAKEISSANRFDPRLSKMPGETATFFWDNPKAANDWAHHVVGAKTFESEKMSARDVDRAERHQTAIMPVRINPGKHLEVDWPKETGQKHYDNLHMQKIINNAREDGYDTVRIKNMQETEMIPEEDWDWPSTWPKPHDQIAVLNPAMIRSEFAQFDPARQHEDDIGARRGGTIDGYDDGGFIPHGNPQREKNLKEFHGKTPSSIRDAKWYHGTDDNFSTFRNYRPIFVTKNPEFAHNFAKKHVISDTLRDDHAERGIRPNIMPVHVRAENPFDYENKKHFNKLVEALGPDLLMDPYLHSFIDEAREGHWGSLESSPIQNAIKAMGHDSFYVNENGEKNLAVYHPSQIKSATGNQGTFDRNDPDITKNEGGEVEDYDDGDKVAPEIKNPMSVFPKPQRMFAPEEFVAGGQYLSMPDKTDMTGHKAATASIGVRQGGKPYFTASRDAVEETGTSGRGSAVAKTNLFKQKAGWKWKDAPEGHEDTNTIVSVEHRGQHHYTLNAHFPKGVDLARYENSPSEPRLRPTTRGNVELGPIAGTILVRGREHPVYHHVIVKNAGGEIDDAPVHSHIAKLPQKLHSSAIIEHALGKVAAPPPAFSQTLMVAKRGRPF